MNRSSELNSNKNRPTLKSNRFQSRNIKLLEEKEKRNRRILFGGVGAVLFSLSVLWIFNQSKDPYQLWLKSGNTGSKSAFVSTLKGDVGQSGDTGAAGEQGVSGDSAFKIWKLSNPNKSESDYLQEIKGNRGSDGDDAYEVWKKSNLQNSRKSESEYRKSLKGDTGDNGLTAFEVWKSTGIENLEKTEDDYIEFLKGNKGETGDSPFEIWKSANAQGDNTEYDYYKYLKGATGADGLSDYEIWKRLSPENENKTKEEYREFLKGDRGDTGGNAGFIPGEVRIFASNINDPDWLLCDGRSFNVSQYPDLFRALKTSTLPDYRGKALAMVNSGESANALSGTLSSVIQDVHLPSLDLELDFSHAHTISGTTTVNGNHIHRGGLYGSGYINNGGGQFNLIYGPGVRQVELPDLVETSGLHKHDVSISISDAKPTTTKKTFSINSGTQSIIDNRQATTYFALYIYAGPKK